MTDYGRAELKEESDINLNSCAMQSSPWHVENFLLPEDKKKKGKI